MKVITLFDADGKIHALFRPSQQPAAPALQFRPDPGYRVEHLEVPAEMQNLKLAQLHRTLHVDLSQGSPRLLPRSPRGTV